MLPIVILGPTASGKSDLARELARELNGEILSADSRKIYRYLDAGTSKPPGGWADTGHGRFYISESVPVHLVDFLDPGLAFSAGEYCRLARPVLSSILQRNRLPIMCGGAGLYVQAFWNGLDPVPGRDPAVRERLRRLAAETGREKLHEKLVVVDPEAASRIHPQNLHRLIRALEVYEITGQPISRFWSRKLFKDLPSPKAVFIGLDCGKEVLNERIRKRSERIFPLMIREAEAALNRGYLQDCPGLRSLGYPEAVGCLTGKTSVAEGLDRLIRLTRAYAKRQITWFRRCRNIRWIQPDPSVYKEILHKSPITSHA